MAPRSLFRDDVIHVLLYCGSVSLLLTSSAFMAGSASAHDQSYIFLWANDPTASSYSPPSDYRYNDAEGAISIDRLAVGEYAVKLTGLNKIRVTAHHAQVTTYSGAPGAYCKIASSDAPSETVTVHCYDVSGVKFDSRFTLLVLVPDVHTLAGTGTEVGLPYAFARADRPTTTSYTITENAYNAGTANAVRSIRTGTGRYTVSWTDFTSTGAGTSIVLASAYGAGNERCQVVSWGGVGAAVACFDATGAPADSEFNVLYWRPETDDPGLAFAWAGSPISADYTPSSLFSYNAAGGAISAQRISTGNYRMAFEDLDPRSVSFGHAQVSAHGISDARCRVGNWSSPTGPTFTQVDVQCSDPLGAPIDTAYSLNFVWPPRKPWSQEFAYATSHSSSAAVDDVTLEDDAFNRAGGPIVIARTATGRYQVSFAGFEMFGGGGNVQVTARSFLGRYCTTLAFTANTVDVGCFDAAGDDADSLFAVFFLKQSQGATHSAYTWADNQSSTSYTPSATYTENPGGGAVTAERFGVGDYRVTFDGFDAIGVDGGHPQVTAFGTNARCVIGGWSNATVSVRCFDPGGNPVDTRYTLLWIRPDLADSALAFAWADDPTIPNVYEPSPFYAFNSGEGSVSSFADTLDGYTILFEDFDLEGVGDGNIQISAYSGLPVYCNTLASSTRLVDLRCHDATGAATTSRFNVLFIKRIAAPEPGVAMLLTIGSGMLGALSRRKRRSASPSRGLRIARGDLPHR